MSVRPRSGTRYQNANSATSVQPPAIHAPVLPMTVSKMTTATPARAAPSSSVPTIAKLCDAATNVFYRCRRNNSRCMLTGATSNTVAPIEQATVTR